MELSWPWWPTFPMYERLLKVFKVSHFWVSDNELEKDFVHYLPLAAQALHLQTPKLPQPENVLEVPCLCSSSSSNAVAKNLLTS